MRPIRLVKCQPSGGLAGRRAKNSLDDLVSQSRIAKSRSGATFDQPNRPQILAALDEDKTLERFKRRIDGSLATREKAVGGHPQDRGFPVHRPARAHNEIGMIDEVRAVDFPVGYHYAGMPECERPLALVPGTWQQHHPHAGGPTCPIEPEVEERILETVVNGEIRRRPGHDDDAPAHY